MEIDLSKLSEAGIFCPTKVDNSISCKDIYFYINKDSWCDGLKKTIMMALDQTPINLLLETDDNIHPKGQVIVAVFTNIAEFKEHYQLIENCIGYKDTLF